MSRLPVLILVLVSNELVLVSVLVLLQLVFTTTLTLWRSCVVENEMAAEFDVEEASGIVETEAPDSLTVTCNCNRGTCIAPPTRRPKAHHRVNPYLRARDRMKQKCFQITTKQA